MNDWFALILAPIISGIVAYLIARPRAKAEITKTVVETGDIGAGTAEKYRKLLNDEIEHRKTISEESEKFEDACKELSEENMQLRSRVYVLREQLIAAGMIPITDLPKTDTRPREAR